MGILETIVTYIVIAILDTGVDSSHSDMGNFLYFQDFTSHGYPSGSTGVDYGHHGTHVASIAAGTGNADTTTQTVEQTISYNFHGTSGWFWTTHWFEVKDHPNNPNRSPGYNLTPRRTENVPYESNVMIAATVNDRSHFTPCALVYAIPNPGRATSRPKT